MPSAAGRASEGLTQQQRLLDVQRVREHGACTVVRVLDLFRQRWIEGRRIDGCARTAGAQNLKESLRRPVASRETAIAQQHRIHFPLEHLCVWRGYPQTSAGLFGAGGREQDEEQHLTAMQTTAHASTLVTRSAQIKREHSASILRAKRIIPVFCLTLLCTFTAACTRVAPYERETLARRDMELGHHADLHAGEEHAVAYREGSSGGGEAKGGGCGCN
jgi:hypothetical protein